MNEMTQMAANAISRLEMFAGRCDSAGEWPARATAEAGVAVGQALLGLGVTIEESVRELTLEVHRVGTILDIQDPRPDLRSLIRSVDFVATALNRP